MRVMPVVIYGAGGHGRVVLDILREMPEIQVVAFMDSNTSLHDSVIEGLPVLGALGDVERIRSSYGDISAVVAIGDNHDREAIAEQLASLGVRFINAVHPRAFVSATATLGSNIVIAAGAIVCAHAVIGDNVIVNTGAIVEHGDVIEANVHIAPGARLAGGVSVRRNAFVGIGATIIENLVIGEYAVVGAGAVVIRDVPARAVAAGVPARLVHPAQMAARGLSTEP